MHDPRMGVLALAGLGGSGRVAMDVAAGLHDAGASVVTLGASQPQWRHLSIEHIVVPSPRVPTPAQIDWVQPLAAALEVACVQHELDVLHVHYGVGLASAAALAKRRLAAHGHRLRVVVTLHGSDVTQLAAADHHQHDALRRALLDADAVTTVSQWLAQQVMSLGLHDEPTVIRNAVDVSVFRPQPGTRAVQRLCAASNFRPIKRPLDAIEIVHRLRGLPAQLSMFGEGPLLAAARRRAEALRLGELVEFPGIVRAPLMAEHLATSSAALITSASESFSLVALEAMACGTPIVATRCGGVEELLEPLGPLAQRMLANVGDIDGLARRARDLLTDAGLHRELSEACLSVGLDHPRDAQLRAYRRVLCPYAGLGNSASCSAEIDA